MITVRQERIENAIAWLILSGLVLLALRCCAGGQEIPAAARVVPPPPHIAAAQVTPRGAEPDPRLLSDDDDLATPGQYAQDHAPAAAKEDK